MLSSGALYSQLADLRSFCWGLGFEFTHNHQYQKVHSLPEIQRYVNTLRSYAILFKG